MFSWEENKPSSKNKHTKINNLNYNNIVIAEEKREDILNLSLEGKLKDTNIELIIDSGSFRNYINKNIAEEFKSNQEECKPITTIFWDGYKRKCDKKALVEII